MELGDRVALNDDCVLQTHLFEDRVLKASRLRIGADCAVGPVSVVLYDSEMEDGTRLDALSLLMKGETLPADTAWAGIPASFQEASRPLELSGEHPIRKGLTFASQCQTVKMFQSKDAGNGKSARKSAFTQDAHDE